MFRRIRLYPSIFHYIDTRSILGWQCNTIVYWYGTCVKGRTLVQSLTKKRGDFPRLNGRLTSVANWHHYNKYYLGNACLMIDDWWLIIGYWWLMNDDEVWWQTIDDRSFMICNRLIGDRWLLISEKCIGMVFHIFNFFFISYGDVYFEKPKRWLWLISVPKYCPCVCHRSWANMIIAFFS